MDLPEIVDGNFWVLTDNFVLVVHVSCGKVDQYVDYEHYINWKDVTEYHWSHLHPILVEETHLVNQ